MNLKEMIVKRSKSVAWRNIDGEVVIVSLEYKDNMDDEIFVLNTTGSYIWNLLDYPATIENIIKNVAKEFKTTENIIEKDIEIFIKDLEKKGLFIVSSRNISNKIKAYDI